MANSFVRYTGNGSTDAYAVPFSYRSQADVAITIDGVATTAYTWDGAGTTVTFTSAPLNLTSIEIRRTTSQAARLVDYADGSVLKENDLDTDSFQGFYMGQEAIDDANDRIKLDAADFQWTAQSKRIKSVADPTAAQDAVTKNYLESTYLTTATIADIALLSPVASQMALLGVAGVITDMGILGTADVVSDMNILATADVVSDMNVLASADFVSDLNTLASSGIVTDMDLLGTSANVTAMGLLGVSGVITNMGLLGTSAVITDMGILGTADVVTDMNVLGTADVVSDMNTLASSAIVTDMDLLATSANVTAMGLLGTSANVTAMGLLGNSATVTDLGILGTAAIVTDLDLLATSANVTAMGLLGNSATVTDLGLLGTSATVSDLSDVADNLAGVTSFAERYRVGGTNPASSLDEGDLFFNTTDNALKYYNGSSWASITAGIGSIADDTTPELGGDLSLNGNNIDFPSTPNISDCLDEDAMGSNSATKLATQQSIKAYVDAVEGSVITTAGSTFANYNSIGSNVTTTLVATKNYFLKGLITVADTYTWDVAGTGTLEII
jgi:hypothetical protein